MTPDPEYERSKVNYYNEHDPKAAAWLRALTAAETLPGGDILPGGFVDDRSVADVTAEEIARFTQHHFFAGIGGWARALDLAGWPSSEPVWSASLPCQPFSSAGQQKGKKDERHLWPVFRGLVEQLLPPVIFGEQVASKLALGESTHVTRKRSVECLLAEAGEDTAEEPDWSWFSTVQADLEDLGYVVGASDLPAAGIGAPHIRQRLYWCAYRPGWKPGWMDRSGATGLSTESGAAGGMGDPCGERRQQESRGPLANEGSDGGTRRDRREPHRDNFSGGASEGRGMGNPDCPRLEGRQRPPGSPEGVSPQRASVADELPDSAHGDGRRGERAEETGAGTDEFRRRGPAGGGFWDDVVYLPCADGKARPIKSRVIGVADGISDGVEPVLSGMSPTVPSFRGRTALLRGYGNAIVPEVAAEFIRAVMAAVQE